MKEELDDLIKYINENNNIPLEVKVELQNKLLKYINSVKIKVHDYDLVDIAKRNIFEYFNKKLIGDLE